jgi:hypothetical protein
MTNLEVLLRGRYVVKQRKAVDEAVVSDDVGSDARLLHRSKLVEHVARLPTLQQSVHTKHELLHVVRGIVSSRRLRRSAKEALPLHATQPVDELPLHVHF